jgi:prepilin-type N-terminal cleavage/methylation domain-containing protein/uncharacterized repeat protein (TIGR02543 family)
MGMRLIQRLQSRKGLTLIEVVIASIIFSLIVLAAFSMYQPMNRAAQAIKSDADAQRTVVAAEAYIAAQVRNAVGVTVFRGVDFDNTSAVIHNGLTVSALLENFAETVGGGIGGRITVDDNAQQGASLTFPQAIVIRDTDASGRIYSLTLPRMTEAEIASALTPGANLERHRVFSRTFYNGIGLNFWVTLNPTEPTAQNRGATSFVMQIDANREGELILDSRSSSVEQFTWIGLITGNPRNPAPDGAGGFFQRAVVHDLRICDNGAAPAGMCDCGGVCGQYLILYHNNPQQAREAPKCRPGCEAMGGVEEGDWSNDGPPAGHIQPQSAVCRLRGCANTRRVCTLDGCGDVVPCSCGGPQGCNLGCDFGVYRCLGNESLADCLRPDCDNTATLPPCNSCPCFWCYATSPDAVVIDPTHARFVVGKPGQHEEQRICMRCDICLGFDHTCTWPAPLNFSGRRVAAVSSTQWNHPLRDSSGCIIRDGNRYGANPTYSTNIRWAQCTGGNCSAILFCGADSGSRPNLTDPSGRVFGCVHDLTSPRVSTGATTHARTCTRCGRQGTTNLNCFFDDTSGQCIGDRDSSNNLIVTVSGGCANTRAVGSCPPGGTNPKDVHLGWSSTLNWVGNPAGTNHISSSRHRQAICPTSGCGDTIYCGAGNNPDRNRKVDHYLPAASAWTAEMPAGVTGVTNHSSWRWARCGDCSRSLRCGPSSGDGNITANPLVDFHHNTNGTGGACSRCGFAGTVGFTITFNFNGGALPGNGSNQPPITRQTTAAPNAQLGSQAPGNPARAGHAFAGWFTAQTGGTQITNLGTHTFTAGQTLFAQWTVNAVPSISLSPSPNHIFQAATFGYAARTPHEFTVTNNGTIPIPANALTVTNGSGFTLDGTGTNNPVIPVNGTWVFTVRPSSNRAVGTHTGTITVRGTVSGVALEVRTSVSFTVNAATGSSSTAGLGQTLANLQTSVETSWLNGVGTQGTVVNLQIGASTAGNNWTLVLTHDRGNNASLRLCPCCTLGSGISVSFATPGRVIITGTNVSSAHRSMRFHILGAGGTQVNLAYVRP